MNPSPRLRSTGRIGALAPLVAALLLGPAATPMVRFLICMNGLLNRGVYHGPPRRRLSVQGSE